MTCTLTLIGIEGTPQQIEGPYFVDGMPNRSDLGSSHGTIQEDIPLHLNLNVYDVDDDGSCVLFIGAKVDIWEANPQGIYSGVAEDGTEGKDFLRGYQITDNNGTVQLPQSIQDGMREERFIFMSKLDQQKRYRTHLNGLRKSISIIQLMNKCTKQPPNSDHGPVAMFNERNTDEVSISPTPFHFFT